MLKMRGLLIWACAALLGFGVGQLSAEERGRLVVVAGLSGTEELGDEIARVCTAWEEAGKRAGLEVAVIGRGGGALKGEVRAAIEAGRRAGGALWLVLEGHGYARREDGYFALSGGDLSGSEIREWLEIGSGPVVSLLGVSSGGAMVKALSGKGRVVLSGAATAGEENRIRFGRFLAEAWAREDADEDGDQQVSLLEAALYAARRTRDWYEEKGRILTEHAVWADESGKVRRFDGVKRRGGRWEAADGVVPGFDRLVLIESSRERLMSEAQRRLRGELEAEIGKLRGMKEALGDVDYYQRLEALLLRIRRECLGGGG
jgi:hypothetical protein